MLGTSIDPDLLIFLLLVFATIFLLVFGLASPTMSGESRIKSKTRARIANLTSSMSDKTQSILRERQFEGLGPIERQIEALPWMQALRTKLQPIGVKIPAYQFTILAMMLGVAVAVVFAFIIPVFTAWLVAGLFGAALPFIWAVQKYNKRLEEFESQLPDMLSMLSRALRAGLPFTDSISVAATEMPEPMASELKQTYADINYGMGVRDGFLNMLQRVPSLSLTTMVTAVLVQRETGGNLAEILDSLTSVIRSRFKLNRKVRSLSAEGRMSGWVLGLMPFGLALFLTISSPDYLPLLYNDETGKKLIYAAFAFLFAGILWIRKVIRIQV